MGLALRVYTNIQPVDGSFKFDGACEVHDAQTNQIRNDLVGFYVHPTYTAWGDGIRPFQAYRFSYTEIFHIGSYIYYSDFRNWLSTLAENGHVDQPGDPFYEVLIFSDCEGVINSTISAKLHVDFVRFYAKAKASPHAQCYILAYESMMRAFQIASINGAVSFH